jgi:hypothetical protein
MSSIQRETHGSIRATLGFGIVWTGLCVSRAVSSLNTAKTGRQIRVCIEASGIYHLDLALALHRTKNITVMIANPRATKDFARAQMRRSKTVPPMPGRCSSSSEGCRSSNHSLDRQMKDAGYLPRLSGVVGEGFALARASAFF